MRSLGLTQRWRMSGDRDATIPARREELHVNYTGKKVALTGARGFLGGQLRRRLMELGAEVHNADGDIRYEATFDSIDYSYDYLFHFAAPSSQILFVRQAAYAIETTVKGFLNAAVACRKHGVRLIYPSTGVLSQGATNEYSRCKKLCEDYHLGSGLDALGVRIFATYGEQEGHKSNYASVPYLFARAVKRGESPVIYGDGTQVRDFIYIDDTVSATVRLAEECSDPIVDVGSGESTSFNMIVDILRGLSDATDVAPTYIEQPPNYVHETAANVERLHEYFVPGVSMADGLQRVLDGMPEERQGPGRLLNQDSVTPPS
jgi:UDP-glucose 4-epimerase